MSVQRMESTKGGKRIESRGVTGGREAGERNMLSINQERQTE